jgi:hypothetical protein
MMLEYYKHSVNTNYYLMLILSANGSLGIINEDSLKEMHFVFYQLPQIIVAGLWKKQKNLPLFCVVYI